jgi:hypothetical protein
MAGTQGDWAGPGALDKHTAVGRGQAGGEAKKCTKKNTNQECWSSRAATGRMGVAKFKGEGVAHTEDHESTQARKARLRTTRFDVEKWLSLWWVVVGVGTAQRGPFLTAHLLLFGVWAAASRIGILQGPRTWWVEGRGGLQDKDERALTVTCSQHVGPRNSWLDGLNDPQHVGVCSRERAIWVCTQCSHHSRSAEELAAGHWTSCPRPCGLKTAPDRQTCQRWEHPCPEGGQPSQKGGEIESDTRCITCQGWCHQKHVFGLELVLGVAWECHHGGLTRVTRWPPDYWDISSCSCEHQVRNLVFFNCHLHY